MSAESKENEIFGLILPNRITSSTKMQKTDKNAPKDRPDDADDTATTPDKEKDEKAYFQHLNYIMYCDAYP